MSSEDGTGSAASSPHVVSNPTDTSHQRTPNVASPLACQGCGPVNRKSRSTPSRSMSSHEMEALAVTSVSNWNGTNWNSASKPRCAWILKPAPDAFRSTDAPTCAVLDVTARYAL